MSWRLLKTGNGYMRVHYVLWLFHTFGTENTNYICYKKLEKHKAIHSEFSVKITFQLQFYTQSKLLLLKENRFKDTFRWCLKKLTSHALFLGKSKSCADKMKEKSWRRKQQPTPVSLPGKSRVQRSWVGYSPWGRKESDTARQLNDDIHRKRP